MKKIAFIVIAAVLAAVAVYALDDVTLPADGRFYDGTPTTANFASINLSGDLYATGSVTAVGGLTGTHTNYNCAAATIGAATIQTNATVGGTLGVTGAATFTATATAADLVATNSVDTQSLVVDVSAAFTGDISIDGAAGYAGDFLVIGLGGTNYTFQVNEGIITNITETGP